MAKASLWLHQALLLVAILASLTKCVDGQQGFPFYTAQSPIAFDATKSDENVVVVKEEDAYWGWFSTNPNIAKDVGIIFYTGAFYDERAYAPILREIALRGYPAFLLDIPWSFALASPFRGDLAAREFPEIKSYVIAGHGLGGAVGACYTRVRRRKYNINGLALFSSAPTPIIGDLSRTGIEAISLWGSLDGLVTKDEWMSGNKTLPKDTTKFVEIVGGNHAQMAYLSEDLRGDNEAEISREVQQNVVLSELLALMDRVNAKLPARRTQETAEPELVEETSGSGRYRGLRQARVHKK